MSVPFLKPRIAASVGKTCHLPFSANLPLGKTEPLKVKLAAGQENKSYLGHARNLFKRECYFRIFLTVRELHNLIYGAAVFLEETDMNSIG